MTKISFKAFLSEVFDTSRIISVLFFIATSIFLTAILASSYCFQNISENGISKKNIVAKSSFEVIDTRKTEFLRQENVNKVHPVLTPVEDKYIKESLSYLHEAILEIKSQPKTEAEKIQELDNLLDIENESRKAKVVDYLAHSNNAAIEILFKKTNSILDSILQAGVSETDFQRQDISELVRKNFSKMVPHSQFDEVVGLLENVIDPNLVVDEHATEVARINARNSVKPYVVKFERGDNIIKVGEPVTQFKKDALRKAGYTALELHKGAVFGILTLVILTLTFLTVYIRKYEKSFYNSRYMVLQAVLLLIVAVLTVFTTHFDQEPLYYLILPAYTIILAIFTTPVLASLSIILLLLLFSVVLNFDQQFIFSLVFTTTMASYSVSKINYSRRLDLIRCGSDVAFMALCTTMLVNLFEWQFGSSVVLPVCYNVVCAFFSSIIAMGLLPIIEKLSGAVTPYGLIELADHNQKLLSTLQYKAPGTYHHSLMVANLCEAAAEAIGGNRILARVGAFYHDIGKLERPLFFIENQSYFGVENPHNKLTPRLSKMAIIGHVKKGVELARENGLPQQVIEFIQRHHGESLIGHFYRQAIQQEGAENVQEEQFRYAGPKPNTKETAILMFADAVESAVRSLKNPSSEEIEAMINRIITERLNDGQLTDSPLTLKDIKIIATTFNRVLKGMQHDRIKYQENDILKEQNKIKLEQTPQEKLEKKIEKKITENKENNGE